jgi:phosphoglycolate phosphatase
VTLKTTVQVIFDLDGTLIDSAPDLRLAVNRMLAGHGRAPLSLTQVRAMVGDGAGALIERVLAASGLPAALQGEAVGAFLAFYAQDPVTYTQPYPGAAATLKQLRERGLALAVCTNKPEGPAREVLTRLQLAHYFPQVVGGDTFPFRKPDPRMLLNLLAAGGTPPQRAVLVGDSEVDAATAQAAGVPFILMSYGYRRSAPEEITSLVVLDDLRSLPDLLA